ncbi:MAG: phosphoglycerate dehydrogenase, partial [Ekhidna sp.]|nr:phosphoglycerate dehydrogenase [Ekhidna sp.]
MTEKKRVLIADDMHECIIPLLQDQGFDPIYSPAISRKEILSIIGDFCGLIIRSKTSVDRELIDHAGNLAFVARAGAGMDKLDSQYLEEKGVKIINAPEGNRDAVGEHTLGMLLSLLHRIPVAYDEVSQIVWNREKHRGIELKGKTVGVYGVGNMGISFAMKLQGFDCKLIGYDKYKDELGFD